MGLKLKTRSLRCWRRFWAPRSGPHGWGKFASSMATLLTRPNYGRAFLADIHPNGYCAPSVGITHERFHRGEHVYLGERVYAYNRRDGGGVFLEDQVHIYADTYLYTGWGGTIRVGKRTHIHPGCHLSAMAGDIIIGEDSDLAAGTAIYAFDHGVEPGTLIRDQPMISKGPVTIGDDVWIGRNAVILSGVTIGDGAVVGAGAVVVKDIPANAIAVGNPARVVRMRDGSPPPG